MRPWTWSDYTEAMLVPHGKRECWPGRRPRVLWFHMCTVGRPMTHARLWALEIPKERYYTLSRWAAITWVPATPTGRTLSLTRSVAAHLSDLWVTWWQMWHQFHFGGVAGYRYFLHNRKCRPGEKKEKKGGEKLAGLGRRWRFLKELSPSQQDSEENNLFYKGDTSPAFQGWDEISSGSSVVKWKPPAKLQGTWVLLLTSTLWLLQFRTLPRSLLFSLWSGDYK